MTTKDKVLQLLKKTPDFLSGEKLAQQLEVSRTSIWKAIKELEKAGYRFEHGPTGYRYLPSDVLDAKEIQQELRSFIPDLKVQTMLTSESTMKDAKLAAAQGDSVSKLFVADTQEQARGRFGRPFFAEPGRGIYMSLLLHPDKRFDELPQYTIIAASACVKAIESVPVVLLRSNGSMISTWMEKKSVGFYLKQSVIWKAAGSVISSLGSGLIFLFLKIIFQLISKKKPSLSFPTDKLVSQGIS